jgi:hypothetical protein
VISSSFTNHYLYTCYSREPKEIKLWGCHAAMPPTHTIVQLLVLTICVMLYCCEYAHAISYLSWSLLWCLVSACKKQITPHPYMYATLQFHCHFGPDVTCACTDLVHSFCCFNKYLYPFNNCQHLNNDCILCLFVSYFWNKLCDLFQAIINGSV